MTWKMLKQQVDAVTQTEEQACKHAPQLTTSHYIISILPPPALSPEVFPELDVSCPGAPRQQGPVVWRRAGFLPCWWGQLLGGVPHCWGW